MSVSGRATTVDAAGRFLLSATFGLVFAACFLVSGILVLSELFPGYRIGLVPAAVLPLLVFHPLEPDRVLAAAAAFAAVAVASGLAAGAEPLEVAAFLRMPVFAWLLARLAAWAAADRRHGLARLMLAVALVQGPAVLLETRLDVLLPYHWRMQISDLDLFFGTFCVKCDTQMSFFLCAVMIVVHFAPSRVLTPARRWAVSAVCLGTVLFTHAEAMKLAAVAVLFGAIVAAWPRPLRVPFVVTAGLLAAMALALMPDAAMPTAVAKLSSELDALMTGQWGAAAFHGGGYARGYAIGQAFDEGLRGLGDGPGSWHGVFAEFNRYRITDTYAYLYREVGIAGLAAAVAVLAALAWPRRAPFGASLLLFGVLLWTGVVVNVFTNPPVLFAAALAARLLAADGPDQSKPTVRGPGVAHRASLPVS